MTTHVLSTHMIDVSNLNYFLKVYNMIMKEEYKVRKSEKEVSKHA